MAKPRSIGQWILNVVYLGFQPSEIVKLTFSELEFYSRCHDKIQAAFKKPKETGG